MGADRGRDQRENPLGVGLPLHQTGGAHLPQPGVEQFEIPQRPVVREDPAVLQKRVGVDHRVRSGGGIAHVSDEGRARHLVRLGGKVGVLPRRYRLLVQFGPAPVVEHAQTRPVGVSLALGGKAIRGVEQPKRGGDAVPSRVQAKESAHGVDGSWS